MRWFSSKPATDRAPSFLQEDLSIVVAKVNTEGLKAADVFYVERPGGGKLSDPARAEGLRQKLLATLDGAAQ